MKTVIILAAVLCLTGCTNFPAKLEKWDALGIKEATITGKFSHTTYRRSQEGGVITSELEHNNPWLPKVHIVRERQAAD